MLGIHIKRGRLALDSDAMASLESKDLVHEFPWKKGKSFWTVQARYYRPLITRLIEEKIEYHDHVSDYKKMDFIFKSTVEPRPHQQQALEKWIENQGVGVVQMPTGAGKTILAMFILQKIKRSTLVVVPTIELLKQWQEVVKKFFDVEVGLLGGGSSSIKDVTIATYDSACNYRQKLSSKFGLLVVDECHHLPAQKYQKIAWDLIAPFRLGLSATVEREDGAEELLYEILGPKVFEGTYQEMSEGTLAPFDCLKIDVELEEDERQKYEHSRQVYLGFVRKNSIKLNQRNGWQEFIRKASYLPGGRDAMWHYREQKNIALFARQKVDQIWQLLNKHVGERIIIFTNDNSSAYQIGEKLVLPVITHQTSKQDRQDFLGMFRSGELDVLVTSKVLNEGVDVPEASVAIVVSGSGVSREHIQRLGRVLRHRPGKIATMYEMVTKNTIEKNIFKRRRAGVN